MRSGATTAVNNMLTAGLVQPLQAGVVLRLELRLDLDLHTHADVLVGSPFDADAARKSP